ncbi:NADP-specific glutamate dehydrogenase [Nafulsella turpanensis]|uniref:NADP-specific glutamate dehydrogenase n=1 Tax=Nafulsella turpanensis TaxID=1265690 RepID=UPI00034B5F97|nr:NADP-specific glutamate dehydrogenase [Nafulsella turpanensis]
MSIATILEQLKQKNPNEEEFHQTAEEVLFYFSPVLEKHKQYQQYKIVERMLEPDRVISFRVNWVDDAGEVQVNRGYRVQMNSALGPYKGGLRFSPTVSLGEFKFLAFEQTFKNALTGIPLGAGKGGADFDPRGKSDGEVMRFCQAFMQELYRHIGNRLDVPAGDKGVGAREIGFLFGTYKKLQNQYEGVLTGKGINWGGSLMRTEATGYGLVYFAQEMLRQAGEEVSGKRCIVSGSGNVSQYCIEKLIRLGAKVVTVSDSSGFIYDEKGIDEEKLAYIKELKNEKRGRIEEYARKFGAEYTPVHQGGDSDPLWNVKAELAFPCATQNEVQEKDVQNMKSNGVFLLAEGANMPLTAEATKLIEQSDILYGPGKAANAGGVAVSGIEMMQNYIGSYWSAEEVDSRLKKIMCDIHNQCLQTAEEWGFGKNYAAGANIAGFIRVADAMIAQGVI